MATKDTYLLELTLKDGTTVQLRRISKEGKRAERSLSRSQQKMQREFARTSARARGFSSVVGSPGVANSPPHLGLVGLSIRP